MLPLSIAQILSWYPAGLFSNVAVLFIGGIAAFILAYLLTFGVIAVCRKMGWLDQPAERRVHKIPMPRMGGVAMFLAFVIVSLVLYTFDPDLKAPHAAGYWSELTSYWFFLAAAVLIVIVHVYDDIKGLKPLTKLIFQTIAIIIVLAPWGDRFHGVLFFGFSNPFSSGVANPALPWYVQPEITLFIHSTQFLDSHGFIWAVIPSVVFTWFWMAGMMNAVNWTDGVDGLATGVCGISALFITVISWVLGQHTIALLAAIFSGAVLGFLPHNWNPAKIFMGDTGSQFLGLGLAVLSIIGGAKVALALMVMGVPILDMALVIINRVRRGYSPTHADKTHLHHRLLATGLTPRQICYIMYGLTLAFGIFALNFPRIYKLIGLALVFITLVGLIIWLDYLRRKHGDNVEGQPGPERSAGDAEQHPPVQVKSDETETTSQLSGLAGEHVNAQLPQ